MFPSCSAPFFNVPEHTYISEELRDGCNSSDGVATESLTDSTLARLYEVGSGIAVDCERIGLRHDDLTEKRQKPV